MDPTQLKLFLEALKKGDARKASEIAETVPVVTDFDAGYKKALKGMVASVENKEVNSLFSKMVSGTLTKKSLEDHRRESRKMSSESFRPASERGYEKAWYDVLSIFLEKKKVGLEEYIDDESA